MGFYKIKNIYKITRMTGSQNNILKNFIYKKEHEIEIIEWHFPSNENEKILKSKGNDFFLG